MAVIFLYLPSVLDPAITFVNLEGFRAALNFESYFSLVTHFSICKYILRWSTNASSFYRSQNFLCQTKNSFTYCGSHKHVFVTAQKFLRCTKCSQIFGLAQKIWNSKKHFGTCKRTRHKTTEFFLLFHLVNSKGHLELWYNKPFSLQKFQDFNVII